MEIVATEMTREQMVRGWDDAVQFTRSSFPNYPALPLILPDKTYTSGFTLQDGRIRGLYLGPSHTRDGIFVFFPEEKVLYGYERDNERPIAPQVIDQLGFGDPSESIGDDTADFGFVSWMF